MILHDFNGTAVSSSDDVRLANMLCKGWKNVEKGAFIPQFCINIQNDRKIANKALLLPTDKLKLRKLFQ